MSWTRQALLAAILAVLFGTMAFAAPAFDAVVPENSAFYLGVHSVPKLRADLENSDLNALWLEPSVQAFLEMPKVRLNELLAEQEAKVGFTLAEAVALLEGQVGVAVWTEPELQDGAAVIMAEVGQNGERAMQIVRAIADGIAKEAETGPLTYVEETYNGAKLVLIRTATPPDAAAEEFDPDDAFYVGLAGDVLLLGGPQAALRRTVDALAAPPAVSLSGNASYQAVLQKLNPDSDIIAYASAPRIIEAIRAAYLARGVGMAAEMGMDPAAQMQGFDQGVSALGFDTLDSISIGYRLDGDFATGTIFARVNGAPRGILKILMQEPGPLHGGEGIPAEVASFGSARVNLPSVWDEIQRIIAGFSPQAMTAINAYLNQVANTLGQPFDLKSDVLSVLGPRFSTFTWYEKPYNLMTSQNTVVAVDISSAAAFDNARQKLQMLFPEQLGMYQQQDYMGYRVFSVPEAAMPGGLGFTPMQDAEMGPASMAPMPAFAVTDKQLIISNKLETVQAHLRRLNAQGPVLADLPEFQDAMRNLPTEGRIVVDYRDNRKSAEFFLTILKEGQLDFLLQTLSMAFNSPEIAGAVNLFDFSKTPPPEDVIKHLSPDASAITVGPDGLIGVRKARIRSQAK